MKRRPAAIVKRTNYRGQCAIPDILYIRASLAWPKSPVAMDIATIAAAASSEGRPTSHVVALGWSHPPAEL